MPGEEATEAEYLKNITSQALEGLKDKLGPRAVIVILVERSENNQYTSNIESSGGLIPVCKLIMSGLELLSGKLFGGKT